MKSPSSAHVLLRARAALRFAPYAIALFFMLWSLRGISSPNIVASDAARHAMNGAFIHDLLRDGKVATPIAYGQYYYSRLPALSIPYHPPMFPVIESIFFAVLGVNVKAARFAVAFSVALSALLFYRLLLATHGSHLLAICSVLTSFSLRGSLDVANDVMLEFPAMVFVLGALFCLRDIDRDFSVRRGLMFAALAGAAVWTKQHAVFLGLVPFIIIVLNRRWRLLGERAIWISSLVLCLLLLPLAALSWQFAGTGMDQVTYRDALSHILSRNLLFYLRAVGGWLGLIPALLGVLAVAYVFFRARKLRQEVWATNFYLSWAAGIFLLLLPLNGYDFRYLFFLAPPLIVLGFSALIHLSHWIWPTRAAAYIPVAVVVLIMTLNLRTPAPFLHGPAEAAQAIISSQPQRVLYCGTTNGAFIFSARSLDPELRTVIIRGEKLPGEVFTPAAFESFAHRYGINYVVLEHTEVSQWGDPMPWDELRAMPSASMVFERNIPMTSSETNLNGDLRIYRFTNPASKPDDSLRLMMPKIGGAFDARF